MNTLTVDFDSVFASLGDDIEEFSFRTQLKVRTILKAIDEFFAVISIRKIPVGRRTFQRLGSGRRRW